MADRTLIEWTDATWNPVTGCSKVSPGCAHCYAERMERRFRQDWKPWTAANAGHNVQLHPDRLDQPLKWRKPRRIFVCSMSDLFHEQVPDEFILQVFLVMAQAKHHIFQVLTKRPERMLRFIEEHVAGPAEFGDWTLTEIGGEPLRNVWLGVTVEDQSRADERIPLLLATPAAVRFLSCEPLLGPVKLPPEALGGYPESNWWAQQGPHEPRVHWVIVGGESGPGARPMHPDWVRSIRDQCKAAGIAFFFKQWGEWLPADEHIRGLWPERANGHVIRRQWWARHDWGDGLLSFRVGRKRAGRKLDGRTWDEMPEVFSNA